MGFKSGRCKTSTTFPRGQSSEDLLLSCIKILNISKWYYALQFSAMPTLLICCCACKYLQSHPVHVGSTPRSSNFFRYWFAIHLAGYLLTFDSNQTWHKIVGAKHHVIKDTACSSTPPIVRPSWNTFLLPSLPCCSPLHCWALVLGKIRFLWKIPP